MGNLIGNGMEQTVFFNQLQTTDPVHVQFFFRPNETTHRAFADNATLQAVEHSVYLSLNGSAAQMMVAEGSTGSQTLQGGQVMEFDHFPNFDCPDDGDLDVTNDACSLFVGTSDVPGNNTDPLYGDLGDIVFYVWPMDVPDPPQLEQDLLELFGLAGPVAERKNKLYTGTRNISDLYVDNIVGYWSLESEQDTLPVPNQSLGVVKDLSVNENHGVIQNVGADQNIDRVFHPVPDRFTASPTPIETKNHIWWAERADPLTVARSSDPRQSLTDEIDENRREINEAIIFQTSNDLPDTILQDCSISLDNTKRDVPQLSSKYDWSDKTAPVVKHSFPYPYRRLNRHSRFGMERQTQLLGGTNFEGNKRNNLYQSIVRNPFGPDNLVVDLKSLVDKPKDDELNVKLKRRLHATAYIGDLDNDPRDGDVNLIAPFSIYETKGLSYDLEAKSISFVEQAFSSRSGYAKQLDGLKDENNLDITGLHTDSYGDSREHPLQGPFTHRYVGGHQHRHVQVGTPASKRPEAFKVTFQGTGVLNADEPQIKVSPLRTPDVAKAYYMRDELAKRPVNIRNIKTVRTPGSDDKLGNHHHSAYSRVGNFFSHREIMSAGSRALNNRDFIENTDKYSDLDNLSLFNRTVRSDKYQHDDLYIINPVRNHEKPYSSWKLFSPERYTNFKTSLDSLVPIPDVGTPTEHYIHGYWFQDFFLNFPDHINFFYGGFDPSRNYKYTWLNSFDNPLDGKYIELVGSYASTASMEISFTNNPLVYWDSNTSQTRFVDKVSDDKYYPLTFSGPLSDTDNIKADSIFLRHRDFTLSPLGDNDEEFRRLLIGANNPFTSQPPSAIGNLMNISDVAEGPTSNPPLAQPAQYNFVPARMDQFDTNLFTFEPTLHRQHFGPARDQLGNPVGGPSNPGIVVIGHPCPEIVYTFDFSAQAPVIAGSPFALPVNLQWAFTPATERDRFSTHVINANDPDMNLPVLGINTPNNQGGQFGDVSGASIPDFPGIVGGGFYAQAVTYMGQDIFSAEQLEYPSECFLSFEIAAVQAGANVGVARTKYGLTHAPEQNDDVWLQYSYNAADANGQSTAAENQTWTTAVRILGENKAQYSNWTSVTTSTFIVPKNSPTLRFRIVNQVTGNARQDQWIMRDLKFHQVPFATSSEIESPPPMSISSLQDARFQVVQYNEFGGVGIDYSGDRKWHVRFKFNVQAGGAASTPNDARATTIQFGQGPGGMFRPTDSREDLHVQYKTNTTDWKTMTIVQQEDAAANAYRNSTQVVAYTDALEPDDVVFIRFVCAQFDSSDGNGFNKPWLIDFMQWRLYEQDPADMRYYSAMKLQHPWVGINPSPMSIDLSFNLQILRTYRESLPAGVSQSDKLVIVVAAEPLGGDPNNIQVLTYHEIDFATLLLTGPQANVIQGSTPAELQAIAETISEEGKTNINPVQINNIPIPAAGNNLQHRIYFVIERETPSSNYRFIFNNLAVHYSGLQAEDHYTEQDFREYLAHLLHKPLEKAVLDRSPSGDHIIVERFSSPGDIYTIGEGSLDRLSGQYSPYNALSFRNRKLRNILNIQSSKVYNGPYDSTIIPAQQIHDARADNKVPEHKVHRNTEYSLGIYGFSNPLQQSSSWSFQGGVDIIDVDIIDT